VQARACSIKRASHQSTKAHLMINYLEARRRPFEQVGRPSSSAVYPIYEAGLLQDVGILLNEIGVVDATSAGEQKGATKLVNS
jgi:hypothetical protein